MKKAALMALSIFLLGSMISTGCGSGETSKTSQVDKVALGESLADNSNGVPVALFSSEAMTLKGGLQPMSEWVGKQPVVVNFWGTWCPPCRREIPELVKLYAEYHPKGVEIISLAVRDTPSKVENYASMAKMNWVMLMATEDVAKEFGLAGSVPTTVFYDKYGKEQARFVGARDYATFKQAFEKILADG